MELNKIYLGDNLSILKDIPSESIDLIYLDPPFFTQQDWNKNGNSFSDKFKNMEEYISFMSLRLKELHRVLKSTGSIYLHCDYHASHYLKIEMDKIFGYNNFKNEIIWCMNKFAPGIKSSQIFPSVTNSIFLYTKTDIFIFSNENISSVWKDIGRISREYPTQKPEPLLVRIISASSNPSDIVLDPFMGSGTTCVVAKKLGRNYIGIDISQDAINLSEKRLSEVKNKAKSLFDFE